MTTTLKLEKLDMETLNAAYRALRRAAIADSYEAYVQNLMTAYELAVRAAPDGMKMVLSADEHEMQKAVKLLQEEKQISGETAKVLETAMEKGDSLAARQRTAHALAEHAEESKLTTLLANFALLDVEVQKNVNRLKREAGDEDAEYGAGGSDEYRRATERAASEVLDGIVEGARTGATVGGGAGSAVGGAVGGALGTLTGLPEGDKAGAAAGSLIVGTGWAVGGGILGGIIGAIAALFAKKKGEEGEGKTDGGGDKTETQSSGFMIPAGREDDPTWPGNDPFSPPQRW
jgi:hypothetical protein